MSMWAFRPREKPSPCPGTSNDGMAMEGRRSSDRGSGDRRVCKCFSGFTSHENSVPQTSFIGAPGEGSGHRGSLTLDAGCRAGAGDGQGPIQD